MRVILCAFGISRRTDVFEEFAIDYNLTANQSINQYNLFQHGKIFSYKIVIKYIHYTIHNLK